MSSRWWVYQRERFPVFVFGVFIASVCVGVLIFSAKARGADGIAWQSFVVAFVSTFLFFLQLRIADEHKDDEDDAAARPYRPVPRGLVRLGELRVIAAAAVIVQAVLVVAWSVRLLPFLLIVLAYLGLMTKEFFIAKWLRTRPLAYLLSHQVILPLIYLFISACDWLVTGSGAPRGLPWILAMGYASGMVVEIGRKIRMPQDEEDGVETYSALWGKRGAVAAWLTVVLASGALALAAGTTIGVWPVMIPVVALFAIGASAAAALFLRSDKSGAGKLIDTAAGLWTVGVHLTFAVALLR